MKETKTFQYIDKELLEDLINKTPLHKTFLDYHFEFIQKTKEENLHYKLGDKDYYFQKLEGEKELYKKI